LREIDFTLSILQFLLAERTDVTTVYGRMNCKA